MSITINIPAVLRGCSGGARELSVSAASVRAVLDQLEQSHPQLYRSVCDDSGALRRHVNLFVNSANVRDENGLDTAMAPGDILTIMPAVSGG